MKEVGTIHWRSPNTAATNSSGFAGLPGGMRNYNGSLSLVGGNGYWWCASEYDATGAWYRCLGYDFSNKIGHHRGKALGFSVRVVKD